MKTVQLSLLMSAAMFMVCAPNAFAISGCSNLTLTGTYGGVLSSAIKGANTNSYQRVNLDGAGNVRDKAFGTPSPKKIGTYSVGSDCSVSVTLDATSTEPSLKFVGIILNGGRDVYMAQSGSGTLTAGTFTRGRNSCSNSDLSGQYGYLLQDNTLDNAQTGYFIADANGNIIGSNDTVVDGDSSFVQKSAGIKSGTYSVAADCTITISVPSTDPNTGKAATSTIKGVLIGDGTQIVVTSAFGKDSTFGTIRLQ